MNSPPSVPTQDYTRHEYSAECDSHIQTPHELSLATSPESDDLEYYGEIAATASASRTVPIEPIRRIPAIDIRERLLWRETVLLLISQPGTMKVPTTRSGIGLFCGQR